MVVTRNGIAGGLVVANHAKVELNPAFVHVRIPRQQTREETVWDHVPKEEDVTHVDVQVTI